jgi:tRNA A-37 threonylcarbamoyl transferase component Bud32
MTLDYICPHCETECETNRCTACGKLAVRQKSPAPEPEDPFIGRVIVDKYRITTRIGKGGMGSVYKAQHMETDGIVAVKLIRTDLLEDETIVRRFYIEAQNTHQLHHQNTIRVSDFGETDDGALYLVMEYLDGRPLADVLRQERRLAPARVVHIAEQVLKSLGEAHNNGVVHRDIKPDNIMLIDQFGEQDFVKVLDFGVSRSLEGAGASTRGAIGTPKYMAPEQWAGKEVDGRADLYAIGGVMYHCLLGRQPFAHGAPPEDALMLLMQGHLNERALPPDELAPGVCPPELSQFIMSLLEKDPAERPSDAAAALGLLRKISQTATLASDTAPVIPGLDDAMERTRGTGAPDTFGYSMAAPKPDQRRLLKGAIAALVIGLCVAFVPGLLETEDEAQQAPDPASLAEAKRAAAAARTPGELSITSTPSGAKVASASGAHLGETPLKLSGDALREADVLVLTAQGHRSVRSAPIAALKPGERRTISLQLKALPLVILISTPIGATVRREGTEESLGVTPIDWRVPGAIVDSVNGANPLKFTFELNGHTARTLPVDPAALESGRAIVNADLTALPKPSARQERKRKRPASAPAPSKPASGKKKVKRTDGQWGF